MKVTMLLADYCQVDGNNKLTAVGAGWSLTEGGPNAVPFGIGVILRVPWDRANEDHHFVLELLTEDGAPVHRGEPGDATTIKLDGTFRVGRPADLTPGTDLDWAFALNSGPLPLPPGMGFVWRLSINHDEVVDQISFRTRP